MLYSGYLSCLLIRLASRGNEHAEKKWWMETVGNNCRSRHNPTTNTSNIRCNDLWLPPTFIFYECSDWACRLTHSFAKTLLNIKHHSTRFGHWIQSFKWDLLSTIFYLSRQCYKNNIISVERCVVDGYGMVVGAFVIALVCLSVARCWRSCRHLRMFLAAEWSPTAKLFGIRVELCKSKSSDGVLLPWACSCSLVDQDYAASSGIKRCLRALSPPKDHGADCP